MINKMIFLITTLLWCAMLSQNGLASSLTDTINILNFTRGQITSGELNVWVIERFSSTVPNELIEQRMNETLRKLEGEFNDPRTVPSFKPGILEEMEITRKYPHYRFGNRFPRYEDHSIAFKVLSDSLNGHRYRVETKDRTVYENVKMKRFFWGHYHSLVLWNGRQWVYFISHPTNPEARVRVRLSDTPFTNLFFDYHVAGRPSVEIDPSRASVIAQEGTTLLLKCFLNKEKTVFMKCWVDTAKGYRVTREEYYQQQSGKPDQLMQSKEFLSFEEFPFSIQYPTKILLHWYDGEGQVYRTFAISVNEATFNSPLPDDLFDFDQTSLRGKGGVIKDAPE